LGIGIEGYRLYVYQANENWEPVGDPLIYEYPGAMPVSLAAETGLKYVIQATAFDVLGEGPLSPQAAGAPVVLQDIAEFAADLRPPRIVDSLPDLPNPEFPVGSSVVLRSGGTLYINKDDTWQAPIPGENSITSDMIQANAITTAKIAAGAVGADQISAGAITADKIGANQIITSSANIAEGIIKSAHIESLDASKIRISDGSSPIPYIINSDIDHLAHFNNSVKTTSGIEPNPGYEVTFEQGVHNECAVLHTDLEYNLPNIDSVYTISVFASTPPVSVRADRKILLRRSLL
jgi:hypothetical protein